MLEQFTLKETEEEKQLLSDLYHTHNKYVDCVIDLNGKRIEYLTLIRTYSAQLIAAKDEENIKLRQHNTSMVATIQDRDREILEKSEHIKELEEELEAREKTEHQARKDMLSYQEEVEDKVTHIAELEKNAKVMYEKMRGKIQFEKDRYAASEKNLVEHIKKGIEIWEWYQNANNAGNRLGKELDDLKERVFCEWCGGKGMIDGITSERGEVIVCEHCKGYGLNVDKQLFEKIEQLEKERDEAITITEELTIVNAQCVVSIKLLESKCDQAYNLLKDFKKSLTLTAQAHKAIDDILSLHKSKDDSQ